MRSVAAVAALCVWLVAQGAASPVPDITTAWSADRIVTPQTGFAVGSVGRGLAIDSAGRLHTLWTDQSTGSYDVFHARSSDDGLTWSTPVDVSASPLPAYGGNIAVGPGDVLHAAWVDRRIGATNPRIHYSRSTDLGATWSVSLDISGAQNAPCATPSITVDTRGRVHISWHTGEADVLTDVSVSYYARSTDGGLTFATSTRLNPVTGQHAAFPRFTVGGTNGDLVALAWRDARQADGDYDLYMAVSTDGGATFTERLVVDTPLREWDPDTAVDPQGRIHVSYMYYSSASAVHIRYVRSDDQGRTWTASVPLSVQQSRFSFWVPDWSRSRAWLFWKDERDAVNIVSRSLNPDGSWSDLDWATNFGTADVRPRFPSPAVGPDGRPHVVWSDTRYGDAHEVVVARSRSARSALLSVSPSGIRIGAIRQASNGLVVAETPAQPVTVSTDGGPAPDWAVSADGSWLQLSTTGGVGAGQFAVTLYPGASALLGRSQLTGTVTATSVATGQSLSVPVTVDIYTVAGTRGAPPVGQVDTPAQSAAGVQGAIGVTGWVLDDIGVTGVKVYRNCLSFDNPASCQTVLGNNVVEVGDAAFLAGARPDVESAFTTYPQNNRAGWGYLMLTSMLPNVTTGQPYGGQGPLTIYAVATDVEGNQKLLGRSSDRNSADFATPTQVTLANDSIAKPFGAIDTPAQGQTVSGVLNNFGWALTPDSNTLGSESSDILIPTDGSTMTVFIDGLPVAQVAYNQCRGNVGNPVPAGVYCNDDVANIFGNATPQAVLTTRTGNATRYRNLDAGRAAIGAYSFNTATLSNGLHTIAWSVTDSAGRTEGIGSRFFIVLNGG